MKLSKAIFALSLLVSPLMVGFTAHAEDDVQVVERPTTTVFKDSSEYNRMKKQWTAQWQLFGVGPNGTSEGALIFGYHVNRNSVIQVEAGNGGSNGGTWFTDDHYDLSGTTVGVHFKHFVGNSFYVKMGADYRTVDYKYDYSSGNSIKFSGDSIAAGLVIGNQWQWDNFTLGCDWIGLSVPLSSTVKTETIAAGTDSYYRSELDSAERNYLKNGFAQGLRFYVGLTF